MSYMVTIAMHNEAHNVEPAVKNLLLQRVTPKLILLIDDGSSDSTYSAIKSYTDRYHKIVSHRIPRHPKNYRTLGNAIRGGLESLGDKLNGFEAYGFTGADLRVGQFYWGKLYFRLFEHRLGTASGHVVGEDTCPVLARGGGQLVNWRVMKSIDLSEIPPSDPDTYMNMKAYALGYKSRMFNDLPITAERTTHRHPTRTLGLDYGLFRYPYWAALAKAASLRMGAFSFLVNYARGRRQPIDPDIPKGVKIYLRHRMRST